MSKPAAAAAAGSSERDISRWVVVYPSYLDSEKTLQEGRRIPKRDGVGVPRPQLVEMFEAMKKVGGVDFAAENKSYSRDCMTRGRIRVMLFDNETRAPVNQALPTRRALFEAMAKELPAVRLAIQSKAQAASGAQVSGSQAATTKKKKNRK